MRVSLRENLLTHTILLIAAVIALMPFATIIARSLGGQGGIENFGTAWEEGRFATALTSSLLVATSVVVIAAVLAATAGYALATMRVPGARLIVVLLLVGIVLPYEVTVVPLYELLRSWGLIDTYWALILPQSALSIPLAAFWMTMFFRSVPFEIIEAARIDGATRFDTLRLILLPLAGPALATLSTILFLFTWNEFLLALILIPENTAAQTAPLALSFFSGNSRSLDPAVTAAAAVLVALPVVIVYAVLQRRLIAGITDGAVK